MRLASVDGHRGKPSLFLSTSFDLFVGNPGQEELLLSGTELCGFNTGQFEQKLVTGRIWFLGSVFLWSLFVVFFFANL